MKTKIFILLLFVSVGAKVIAAKPLLQNFDKTRFYSVLKSGDISSIDNEILLVNKADMDEKEAYEGTLLMKKAGLTPLPKDKLRLFKSGRIKLETALASDATNTEYHFLRLIIEEHAPKVVKYKSDLQSDSRYVSEHFKVLPATIQKAVLDYSKTSKALPAENLKFAAE